MKCEISECFCNEQGLCYWMEDDKLPDCKLRDRILKLEKYKSAWNAHKDSVPEYIIRSYEYEYYIKERE